MSSLCQPTILTKPVPPHACHLFFDILQPEQVRTALDQLGRDFRSDDMVVGLGLSALLVLGKEIPGLRIAPALTGVGVDIPSTQHALWCWVHGPDRGDVYLRSQALIQSLAPTFRLARSVDAYRYGSGLDLTGFEDGTENPVDDAAIQAGTCSTGGPGLLGGSFAAIQQWKHDFPAFNRFSQSDKDNLIGRRQSDNEEIEDAPASAHVKRTAQEDFEPEAFVVRRSMPWSGAHGAGLMFLSFGHSFDGFEAQQRRMLGLDDGILDGLYRFSRPITNGYYWCPPICEQGLDLQACGCAD